jgi:hypothetical protein
MKKQKSLSRSAYDLLRKSNDPSVWLLYLGDDPDHCGRIVTAYTVREAPSGGYTCYATVYVDRGPLEFNETTTGKAGGGGYDKQSTAIADAFNRALPDMVWPNGDNRPMPYPPFDGAGVSAMRRYLETFGYRVVQAL